MDKDKLYDDFLTDIAAVLDKHREKVEDCSYDLVFAHALIDLGVFPYFKEYKIGYLFETLAIAYKNFYDSGVKVGAIDDEAEHE